MIKFLLNRGADATAKDSDGNTPLHCIWRSPRKGSTSYIRNNVIFKLEETVQIAELLLERGADLHAQNDKQCCAIRNRRMFCILK
jgi:ankyrin repeat protein